MIRDRIVVGVSDDNTRLKLLQIRDLTLTKAIDVCKASEAVGKQAVTNAEEVQAIAMSKRRRNGKQFRGRNATQSDRGRDNSDKSQTRTSCKYCGRQHDARKEACPAYGQTCRRCQKRNDFESVCQAKTGTAKRALVDSSPQTCSTRVRT